MSCLKYSRVHARVDGSLYEVKAKGGRRKLPPELRQSEVFKAMFVPSMRAEVDEWNQRGYSDTVIAQIAVRAWLDNQKSVQNTVYT